MTNQNENVNIGSLLRPCLSIKLRIGKMDRRTVIKALMGGLAFPVVPIQIEAAKKIRRRIIPIELQGANDGLNTIIPYMDPYYKKLDQKYILKTMK